MLQNSIAFTVGLSILLGLLPAIIWGLFFLNKSTEKRYMIVRTFMLGALMVVPLVIYRSLWDAFPSIDLAKNLQPLEAYGLGFGGLTLNYVFLYLSIGVIEEVSKYFVVKKVDAKEINSVRDSIEFSIIAALGFSFAENTFYFIQIHQNFELNMLLSVFVFRSLFSTFAHILFSAIYGYHAGLAKFAKEIYKETSKKSLYRKFIYKLSKFLSVKGSDLFEDQHRFLGLFLASFLHAIFNLLLEAGITAFLFPFLAIGFIHVSYLVFNRDYFVSKDWK